jgi:hypothetical protein
MSKPKDPKEAVAKLAKETAKYYKLPVPRVAQIFMKYPVDKKGVEKAIAEVQELYRAEVMKALAKAGLI